MPTTYEPIATTTLSSAASSITFSSIPATYTDLRLVLVAKADTTSVYARATFNNDSGTNYSYTTIYGDGTSAASAAATNRSYIATQPISALSDASNQFNLITLDIFSYAGSTYKTSLVTASADKNGSGTTERVVALWRSTSAINRVDLLISSGNYATSTTATLYGIKNA